jgi:hypothetical protein
MEAAPTTPAPTTTGAARPSINESPVQRGIAIASISLGYFSLCVFWWYPFSTVLASVGLVAGLRSLIRGVKGGLHGENLALVGTALCATSLGVTVTLNLVLRYLQWDVFPF